VKPSCRDRRWGGVREIFLRTGEPLGDGEDSRLQLLKRELVEVILIVCSLCDETMEYVSAQDAHRVVSNAPRFFNARSL
jgi:hypothetical protein